MDSTISGVNNPLTTLATSKSQPNPSPSGATSTADASQAFLAKLNAEWSKQWMLSMLSQLPVPGEDGTGILGGGGSADGSQSGLLDMSALTGPSGVSGLSSLAGLSGLSGISDLSGLSGSAGLAGLSGQSGAAGLSGLSAADFLQVWTAAATSQTQAPSTGDLTAGSGPLNDVIQQAIQSASAKYGVPESLIHGVIMQESGMDPNAHSAAGAIGLMQLMPDTAGALGVNPWDPVQNIDGGTKYLSEMLQEFHGDVSLALAAYNAGPDAVRSHGGIPPYKETQAYVQDVLQRMTSYGA